MESCYLYVGSYSNINDNGIYVFNYNCINNSLELVQGISGLENPIFLALSPDNRYLYAVSRAETGSGSVCSFSIDTDSGKLTKNNEVKAPNLSPVHCSVNRDGNFLFVANYKYGNVSLFHINEDGEISGLVDQVFHTGQGIHSKQTSPHPHSIYGDPTGKYVVSPDLGADKIVVYELDQSEQKLRYHGEMATSPGAGPRCFAFHPKKNYAYAIDELDSTIIGYEYEPNNGSFHEIQVATALPPCYKEENYAGDIRISNCGKYLYGSNRGHNSIAIFEINEGDGRITLKEYIATNGWTRCFTFTHDNRFLVATNEDTGILEVFKVDIETGHISLIKSLSGIPKATCVLIKN